MSCHYISVPKHSLLTVAITAQKDQRSYTNFVDEDQRIGGESPSGPKT